MVLGMEVDFYDEALFRQMLQEKVTLNGGYITYPDIEECFWRVQWDIEAALGEAGQAEEGREVFREQHLLAHAEILRRDGFEVRPA